MHRLRERNSAEPLASALAILPAGPKAALIAWDCPVYARGGVAACAQFDIKKYSQTFTPHDSRQLALEARQSTVTLKISEEMLQASRVPSRR
jgi:hypothetical protein